MPEATSKLAADPLLGRSVRQFKVEAKLGEGGMGAVYRALDTRLERPVALKVIRREVCQHPDFLARFQREAKAAARFRHPNAIEIYEYGDGAETDGLVYMAFEYVKGRELRDMIRERGHLDPATSIQVTAQVLSALERAHAQGIVHRDLKPQNVMIEAPAREGGDDPLTVKILDFGIAKLRDASGGGALTQAGTIMGTVHYMSPEQTEGAEVDGRADLYSVGVMLFQMLTGKLPFNGKTSLEVIKQHRHGPIPSVCALRPEVPAALDEAVKRALAKAPGQRFQSAREFRQALQGLGLAPGNVPSDTAAPPGPSTGSSSGLGASREVCPSEIGTAILPPSDGGLAPSGYATGATGRFFDGLLGRTLDDKYEVQGKLGEGGMGAVFKARHTLLGTTVALKVVHPQLATSKEAVERFLREARAALEFTHPNAITTREFGRTRDGLLYMTLDFCAGASLRKVLQDEGRLPAPRALSIARQALSALAEAHAKGIVHRDLKPENLLIEQDDQGELARVCDFGIAKLLDAPGEHEGESLTGQQVIGTPHYMAPEQACADAVDGRTDVYAIGCVLYEMLTGARPFVAKSAKDVLMKQISVPPVPPRERAPDAGISPALEQVVLKAMAKEPAGRFHTAVDFVDAIDALGLDLPRTRGTTSRVGARPPTDLAVTVPPGRPGARSRGGLAAAAAAALFGVAGLIVWQAPEGTAVGGLRTRLVALARGAPASGGSGGAGSLPPPTTTDAPAVTIEPLPDPRPEPAPATPTRPDPEPAPTTPTRPDPEPAPTTPTRPDPEPAPTTPTRPDPEPAPTTPTRPDPEPAPTTPTRPDPEPAPPARPGAGAGAAHPAGPGAAADAAHPAGPGAGADAAHPAGPGAGADAADLAHAAARRAAARRAAPRRPARGRPDPRGRAGARRRDRAGHAVGRRRRAADRPLRAARVVPHGPDDRPARQRRLRHGPLDLAPDADGRGGPEPGHGGRVARPALHVRAGPRPAGAGRRAVGARRRPVARLDRGDRRAVPRVRPGQPSPAGRGRAPAAVHPARLDGPVEPPGAGRLQRDHRRGPRPADRGRRRAPRPRPGRLARDAPPDAGGVAGRRALGGRPHRGARVDRRPAGPAQ
ncbi:MAG: protein kinase [Planctomycetes bacterium]|nr:protein kinase [Planctomycetota bacterium]